MALSEVMPVRDLECAHENAGHPRRRPIRSGSRDPVFGNLFLHGLRMISLMRIDMRGERLAWFEDLPIRSDLHGPILRGRARGTAQFEVFKARIDGRGVGHLSV